MLKLYNRRCMMNNLFNYFGGYSKADAKSSNKELHDNTGNPMENEYGKWFLEMPLEQKRELYKCGKNYVTLKSDSLIPWKLLSKSNSIKSRNQKKINAPEKPYEVDDKLNEKVCLWQGDVTRLEIDAIVNAANRSLLGGGGVDGCIHRAAGRSLVEECRLLQGCDTGKSKITSGHKLPAKYIIHTVGPVRKNRDELESCYKTTLELVLKHEIRSIAFVCVATGIYGYPNLAAAHVALRTVRSWLEQNHEKIEKIIFCTFLEEDLQIYHKLMRTTYFPCFKPIKETGAREKATVGTPEKLVSIEDKSKGSLSEAAATNKEETVSKVVITTSNVIAAEGKSGKMVDEAAEGKNDKMVDEASDDSLKSENESINTDVTHANKAPVKNEEDTPGHTDHTECPNSLKDYTVANKTATTEGETSPFDSQISSDKNQSNYPSSGVISADMEQPAGDKMQFNSGAELQSADEEVQPVGEELQSGGKELPSSAGGEVQSSVEDSQTAGGEVQFSIEELPNAGGEVQSSVEKLQAAVEDSQTVGGEVRSSAEELPNAGGEVQSSVEKTQAAVEDSQTVGGEVRSSAEELPNAGGEVQSSVEKTQAAVEDSQTVGGEVRSSAEELPNAGGEVQSSVEKTQAAVEDSQTVGGEVRSSAEELPNAGGEVQSSVEKINTAVEDSQTAGGEVRSSAEELPSPGGEVQSSVEKTQAAVEDSQTVGGEVRSSAEELPNAGGEVQSSVEKTQAAVEDSQTVGGEVRSSAEELPNAGGEVQSSVEKTQAAVEDSQTVGGEVRSSAEELPNAGGEVQSSVEKINTAVEDSQTAGGEVRSSAEELPNPGGEVQSSVEKLPTDVEMSMDVDSGDASQMDVDNDQITDSTQSMEVDDQ